MIVVDTNTAGIVTAAFAALPSIIGAIRAEHAAANPDAPPLTEAQALAALQAAVRASLAKDAQLRQSAAGVVTDATGEVPNTGD